MDYEKKYKDAQKWIESIYTELTHERQMEAEAFFPELKENEDEKNIKNLIDELKCSLRAANCQNEACNGGHEKRIALLEWAIAWLEKQVETKKPTRDQVWDYCSKISHEWWQIAMDKFNTLTDEERSKYNQFIGFNDFSDILMNITAGALFRLIDTCKLEYEEGSLLLEKPDDTPMPIETTNPIEEQDSQILANSAKTCKVEPKFKVGDWVLWDNKICYHINDIHQGEKYLVYTITDTNNLIRSYAVECFDKNARIWTIDDAKDGDILASAGVIFIFNKVHSIWISCHCSLHKDKSFIDEDYNLMHIKYSKEVYPATKEECDLLFKKMKEAGYEWDAEKKELKKIEQNNSEESNVGNFDIAGLCYAKAILEKTLGKVEGYQSDDSILEHKSAINAVTKLCDKISVTVDD